MSLHPPGEKESEKGSEGGREREGGREPAERERLRGWKGAVAEKKHPNVWTPQLEVGIDDVI